MYREGDKLIVLDNDLNRKSVRWSDRIGDIVTFSLYDSNTLYLYIKEFAGEYYLKRFGPYTPATNTSDFFD